MKNSKLQFDLLLNQIPTKFRGKYIPAFRNNKISKEDLFLELELLADEASTKNFLKYLI